MKPVVYEGDKPYVFISYSHKDTDRVMKIMEFLKQNGIRFWYDDGIIPAKEWTEEIAEHLDGSAMVIAFVSANFVGSDFCRKELTFARTHKKPVLCAFLEETKITKGMELQLSGDQCILRYNYDREEDFIQKILSCPHLNPCREMASSAWTPYKSSLSSGTSKSARPAEPVKPKTTAKPKKSGKPEKNRGGRGALVTALILVLLVLVTRSYLRVRITEDTVVSRNKTYLNLSNAEITEDTVKQINKLSKLQALHFNSCAAPDQILDGLELEELRSFDALNSTVGSLEFLERSPKFYDLELNNCGVTDRLLEDVSLPALSHLNLSNNPELTVLPDWDVSELRQVWLRNTGIADISLLADAKILSHIYCADSAVTDISPLAKLEVLEVLEFSNCDLLDVTETFMSLSMQSLYLNSCGLTDISGFSNFTILETAELGNNRLTDISWLEKSVKTLVTVNLSFNPLPSEQLTFLAQASAMRSLILSEIDGVDLGIVKNMPELEMLHVQDCGISDISALAGLTNLRWLDLSHNGLEAVSNLPKSLGTLSNTLLDLSNNQITNADSIPGGSYHALMLYGNPIAVTDGTFADLSATYLILDYHESLNSSVFADKIQNILVADAPLDQRLALESVLGSNVEFVSTDEIPGRLESIYNSTYSGLTTAG